jgi:hypothetical protein
MHQRFRVPALAFAAVTSVAVASTACTGLMAGPASQSSLRTSVSPDSTYRRARSSLSTEVFTIVEQDTASRWLKATRFRANNAAPNSPLSCRLHLEVKVAGEEVQTTGRWTADKDLTSEKGRATCDEELASARERIEKFAANVP